MLFIRKIYEEVKKLKNVQARILKGIAKLAKEAYYDSSGMASRAGIYEPEMTREVKMWKESHISWLERISKIFI